MLLRCGLVSDVLKHHGERRRDGSHHQDDDLLVRARRERGRQSAIDELDGHRKSLEQQKNVGVHYEPKNPGPDTTPEMVKVASAVRTPATASVSEHLETKPENAYTVAS